MKLQDYIEEYCSECEGRYSCIDLDGDLISEQVKICMNKNKVGLELESK